MQVALAPLILLFCNRENTDLCSFGIKYLKKIFVHQPQWQNSFDLIFVFALF